MRLKKASTIYQILRRKIFQKLKSGQIHLSTGFQNNGEIRKLTNFQIWCLRDILGLTLWDRCCNADILEECGKATMRDQLRLKRLQWFGHLMRMPTHWQQWQILKCRTQGKLRPPGGTPLRWIDVVHKDLASLRNWHQIVNDRRTWRSFIQHSLDGDHTTS